jgi:predicted nucleic acid-binding protein
VGLILDTSFVIAYERERRRGKPGTVEEFLSTNLGETLYIPFTVAGELACGKTSASFIAWQELCRPFRMLPWSVDIAWQYGEIYRRLQSRGTLIGANDLWIAATAITHKMALVTGNTGEFHRVDGLTVIPFKKD